MSNLSYRESLIQKKRKQTPFREFIRDIASWTPLSFYKFDGVVSKFSKTERIHSVLNVSDKNSLENISHNEKEYDSTVSFFNQFEELKRSVPHISRMEIGTCENTEYVWTVKNSKNVYLSNTVISCEEVMESYHVKYSSKVYNSVLVRENCHSIYNSYAVITSSFIFYSKNIENSSNIWFSQWMTGCTECVACSWLTNQQYCIQNKQYSEEEYFHIKKILLSQKENFALRYGVLENKTFITSCENNENTFNALGVKNSRNVYFAGNKKWASDYYDVYSWWMSNDFYWVCNCWWASENIYCSTSIAHSHSLYYCAEMNGCSFCLWCVWLKNKSYCILNKQYTKEERHQKVDEIFWKMEEEWVLGDFLPWGINPFYFNDTAAYLIDDSFTKEEVEELWYLWRDEKIKVDIPEGMDVVSSNDLNQFESATNHWERQVTPNILKKVIQDEAWNYYRIIPMEYKFLKKHGLPLPRKHWLERLKENFTVAIP